MSAATSRRNSHGPVTRSTSSSGQFYGGGAASGFASYSSSFAANTTARAPLFQRSTSPTRVNMYGQAPSSRSVRFAMDRPTSPSRTIAVSQRSNQVVRAAASPRTPRKTCMCSPTNHPGSFRCSLHKNANRQAAAVNYSPNRLNARRSAMTNSLVRIGGVEGDLVRRALAALIRPSSHQQRRRSGFQPRPSRLSVMSRAEEKCW